MSQPKALIICGDGINCDAETAWALNLAGFDAERVHVSDLLQRPALLDSVKMLTLPGGFSFGDEIASGKVLALKIKDHMSDLLHQFVENGNLVLGICNGFQVLVQIGFLPLSDRDAPRVVTLTKNGGGKFVNRWVDLVVDSSVPCHFFDSLEVLQLPVRHGEGRLVVAGEMPLAVDTVKQHAPLRYKEDFNGSFDRIAALSNSTGTVLGLMPHPEAFVRWTQHPNWHRTLPEVDKTRRKTKVVVETEPHGLVILRNAARMLGAQT